MPSTDDFRLEIRAQISRAERQKRLHVEINAGELHRAVGGYPTGAGQNHAMPSCCAAMRDEFRPDFDLIVHETDSGQSASFTVRFVLPR